MSYFRPEIERMVGYVPGEQPQVGKFIKLNTNENPYPPSPAVARAITATLERGLARYPDPLASGFRQRAAELYGVEADWILCGNGSDEILTILTRALVGQGELVRFPYPSYILYKTLAEIQGARCEEIPFEADWSLSDRFAAPAPGLKLSIVPNPNSPTGTVIPPARMLELAEQSPCPLLVDEAYADFAEANCVSMIAKCERLMVSRTLSKSYGLAGLRFGFLIAQPQIVAELRKVKDSYNCDALSIAAATAAIDDTAWLAENRAKILATRERLTVGLAKLGFAVIPSQANFVWAQHPTRPAKALYEGLKQNRILVRPMNYPNWGEGLRISVGTEEQIDACLTLLEGMI